MTSSDSDTYRLDLSTSVLFKEVLALPYPEALFHFTTRASLVPILRDRAVHASSIRHLNDAEEFDYARSLVSTALRALAASTDTSTSTLATRLLEFLDGTQHQHRVFVFSLSEHSDQLSQWRAYCQPADAYAIGFSGPALARVAPGAYHLVRCEYRENEQQRLVGKLLEDVIRSFQDNVDKGSSVDTACLGASAYFILVLLVLAPMLKHPKFAEEAEWRLISNPVKVSVGKANIQFKPGKTLLVPYHELKLVTDDQLSPINEVVVGPTPHRLLELLSVTDLMTANGLRPNVRQSSIPFRPW